MPLLQLIISSQYSSRVLAINHLAWMFAAFSSVSWSKLSETCPIIRQISWPIDIPIIIDALLLLDIQVCMSSSGDVNVFQWNREWFFSRRVKFDSRFYVMAVNEFSWHGPKSFIASRARNWVMRWWKRPFWFSKKIYVTLSLNWSMPCQGGCSQVLISSKGFDLSICDWKNKFSLFVKYHLFRIESFRVDFHRLQLLKVCDQYVTLPNSPGVQCISEDTIQVRLSFQIDGCVTGLSQL